MDELLKIHPGAPTLAYGPSSHEIKHERRHSTVKFCGCQKAGTEFKTCGRCKTAFYCSRQCQKDAWPQHKRGCRPPDFDLQKVLQNFVANKSTKLHLQFSIIVKFDLINKPINLTRPAFDALVDVVMLPTNDSYTLELMDPVKNEELHDAEIDGMLQLWNVRPFASEGDEHDVAEDDALWKLTYDIDPINSASRYPTGFVRYQDIELNDGGKRKIMTHVLSISPLTISMMRVAKSYKVPTDQGDMEIPMTGEMNLQSINEAIALDTTNTWMLRKKLRACDKALLLNPNIASEIKRKMKSKAQKKVVDDTT